MVSFACLEERKNAARSRLIRDGLWSNLISLSQVIDKFHRRVRNGIMRHDITDILLANAEGIGWIDSAVLF
ncbi:MAG: hypothetical protein K0B01_11500 [Syntrophobacterales bacterium]|nr:hypothetical protein [Syntrophobacterales bacterium]